MSERVNRASDIWQISHFNTIKFGHIYSFMSMTRSQHGFWLLRPRHKYIFKSKGSVHILLAYTWPSLYMDAYTEYVLSKSYASWLRYNQIDRLSTLRKLPNSLSKRKKNPYSVSSNFKEEGKTWCTIGSIVSIWTWQPIWNARA